MVRASLAAGLIGGAVGLTALAADSPPPAVHTAASRDQDWVVSHNARRALWSVPTLAELNLGVRVRSGEAFVWGPVPTDDLAAEAIARVRLVAGVRTVVSEIYILPAEDLIRRRLQPPTAKLAAPAVISQPDATPVARLGQPEPAVRAIPSRVVDMVDEARNRQVRFRSLQIEVANGVVTITGSPDRAADAMDLAETVRQLPGVTNVVIRTR